MSNPRYQTRLEATRALKPGEYTVGPSAGFYSNHPLPPHCQKGARVAVKVHGSSLGTVQGYGEVTGHQGGMVWVKITHRGLRPVPVRDGEIILYPVDRLVPR